MNIIINQEINIDKIQVLLSIIKELFFNSIYIDPEKNTLSINKTRKGIKSADTNNDHIMANNAKADIKI